MSVINDGGPAFPFVVDDDAGEHMTVQWGVSLRDWFAGKAMQGLCADYGRTTCMSEGVHANLAMIAYRLADAMIAERDRTT